VRLSLAERRAAMGRQDGCASLVFVGEIASSVTAPSRVILCCRFDSCECDLIIAEFDSEPIRGRLLLSSCTTASIADGVFLPVPHLSVGGGVLLEALGIFGEFAEVGGLPTPRIVLRSLRSRVLEMGSRVDTLGARSIPGLGGGVVVGNDVCETFDPTPESLAPESTPDSDTERRSPRPRSARYIVGDRGVVVDVARS
jgi:hypothetical protein